MKVTLEQAQIVADLVADHWERTGRNPTDAETAAMVEMARAESAANAELSPPWTQALAADAVAQ